MHILINVREAILNEMHMFPPHYKYVCFPSPSMSMMNYQMFVAWQCGDFLMFPVLYRELR